MKKIDLVHLQGWKLNLEGLLKVMIWGYRGSEANI